MKMVGKKYPQEGKGEWEWSEFYHLLGMTVLPLIAAFSSPWSVPFLACMSRWIMSGRRIPFSSRTDIVSCTSDRKKLDRALDMNLMRRNWSHVTEKRRCWCHNILTIKWQFYSTRTHRSWENVGDHHWLYSWRGSALEWRIFSVSSFGLRRSDSNLFQLQTYPFK